VLGDGRSVEDVQGRCNPGSVDVLVGRAGSGMRDVEAWSNVGNAALNGSQDAMMGSLRAESVTARRRRPVTDDDRDDVVVTGARRRTAAALSGTAATARPGSRLGKST